ncbi:Protein Spindly [Microtus ochrogaster]|uniref:Protein Spindly n=1 Tax=Microtus ochrogaster TaxID=79684 RepID=A0A8J6G3T8_MICOH|nr:Protein Spindly [Microtus ochrogaster]
MQPKTEKKCVKLMDGPGSAEAVREQRGNTPSFPRLSAGSKLSTEGKERKETTSKLEKEACKKSHTIMYASSKSALEMQCPQQEEGVALRGLLRIVPVCRILLWNICIHQC